MEEEGKQVGGGDGMSQDNKLSARAQIHCTCHMLLFACRQAIKFTFDITPTLRSCSTMKKKT